MLDEKNIGNDPRSLFNGNHFSSICSAVDFKVFCSFFYYNGVTSTTMESLPLKELDFGLQKPTGPSSGVVASLSLAEVCATCLRCQKISKIVKNLYISCSTHNFFISAGCPFHIPGL